MTDRNKKVILGGPDYEASLETLFCPHIILQGIFARNKKRKIFESIDLIFVVFF